MVAGCRSDSDPIDVEDPPLYAEVAGVVSGADGVLFPGVEVRLVSDEETLVTTTDLHEFTAANTRV